MEDGRPRTVVGSAGDHTADLVVLAAGPWSGELARRLGERDQQVPGLVARESQLRAFSDPSLDPGNDALLAPGGRWDSREIEQPADVVRMRVGRHADKPTSSGAL